MDPARRVLGDGSVLIDGERIAQVGRAADVRPPRPPDRVLDGRGRLVLPGFVDTHVHLSEHLARGLVPDEVPVDRYVPDWYGPLYPAIAPEEGLPPPSSPASRCCARAPRPSARPAPSSTSRRWRRRWTRWASAPCSAAGRGIWPAARAGSPSPPVTRCGWPRRRWPGWRTARARASTRGRC